jgi:replicative DNA helicase
MSAFDDLDLNILKVLTTNKKHALDFVSECDPKLFSADTWNFANILFNYLRTYKELPTLRVLTEKLSKGNNDKLIEHVTKVWAQLERLNYNDKEYKHDLERIKKRFAEKQILSAEELLSRFRNGNIDAARAIVEMQRTVQTVKALNQVRAYERRTLKDAVPIFREEYNAKLENPTFDKGVMTGYSYLDQVTDGLRPGELLLIGGESGSGKSMLLMNMALQIWLQNNTIDMDEGQFVGGHNVLYFSLEMPFKPCLHRVLARLSSNPSRSIRSAKLNQPEADKLKKALRFINKYPHQFEIVDIPRGATMESMELIYEDIKAHYDPKIIVIDYLGLMDYDGGDMEDWLKLGKIAEACHEFSRVHNCIVLSAVQLNRSKSKEVDDRIGLHRIGRSALIMQNANIALQIETRPNETQYPDMNIHLIKNRDGQQGKFRTIKNLACGSLLDDKVEENSTEFHDYNSDDISGAAALLDI